MSLIFFDNFGGYTTADIPKVWAQNLGYGLTVFQSGGRFNGPYAESQVTTQNQPSYIQSRVYSVSSTWTVGFAIYFVSTIPTSNPEIILSFVDGSTSTTNCSLGIMPDGSLKVFNGLTTALNSSSSSLFGLVTNTWYYIEMKVTIADSIGANTCIVNVNGVEYINVDAGQDLKASTNAFCNHIKIGSISNNPYTLRITDIYIKDDTTFLDDCIVEVLTVNGNGATTDFTFTNSDHYTEVDEALQDGDTTYIESSGIGDIDLFTITDLTGVPTLIHGISPWNLVRKTEGGTKTAAGIIRVSGTNYQQTNFNATDSYLYNIPISTGNPVTSGSWTAAEIAALEIGIEVVS